MMQSTKQLARELGLLRRKKLTTRLSGTAHKKHTHNQKFSFLVVLDFESTCWKNSRHRTNEIIEFPAVLLNTSTGEIESEFHYYVLPQENPVLSDFCKQLTGITQEQVEEGIPLRLCVQKFNHWLTRLSRERDVCFSCSTRSGESNAAFVTWSDWDLGVCLLYECRRKQITRPPALNCWIDLRLTYRKFYERRPKGLNGALQDVGISFEGREHSGLHDARNTARLAWRMIQDGCLLEITKSLPASGGPGPTIAYPNVQTGNRGLAAPVRTCVQPSGSSAAGRGREDSMAVQTRETKESHTTAEALPVQQVVPSNELPRGQEKRLQEEEQCLAASGEQGQRELRGCSLMSTASNDVTSSTVSTRVSNVEETALRDERERPGQGFEKDDQLLSTSCLGNEPETKPDHTPVGAKQENLESQTSVLVSSFVEGCEDMADGEPKEEDSGYARDFVGRQSPSDLLNDSNGFGENTSDSQVLMSSFVEGEWDSGFETSRESSRRSCRETAPMQEVPATVQVATGFNQGTSKLGTVQKRTFAWSSPALDTPKFRKVQPHSPLPAVRVGLQVRDMNRHYQDNRSSFSSAGDQSRQCPKTSTPYNASLHSLKQKQDCFKTPSPVTGIRGRRRSNSNLYTSTPKLTNFDNASCAAVVHSNSKPLSSGPFSKAACPSAKLAQRSHSNNTPLNSKTHPGQSDKRVEKRWNPAHAAPELGVSAHFQATSHAVKQFGGLVTPGGGTLQTGSLLSASCRSGTPQAGWRSSSMKRTPPLCQCGRRSRRRLVQTPGPNQGRFFFSCSLGRSPSVGGCPRAGCGFFQWEGKETPVRGMRN